VAGYAHLTGEDDGFADGSRAGQTNLSAEEGVLANVGAVTDLNEIIDFGSRLDAGLTDGGAIDASVGLNLDGIFENCRA